MSTLISTFMLVSCHARHGTSINMPESSPDIAIKSQTVLISPLPGKLNTTPVFYSNRPELITEPGLLLDSSALNPTGLEGKFGVFVHHVVQTPVLSNEQFRLGLLARAAQSSVTLKLTQKALTRTRPEAPFIDLPAVETQQGKTWSGPGSRVSLEALSDNVSENASDVKTWEISEKEILLEDIPVPTNPLFFVQQRNALSGLLTFESDGPVHLRWVALKTAGTNANSSEALKAYQQQAHMSAGPEEPPATQYAPLAPNPGGVFRFGRVAGIVQGSQWQGETRLSELQWQQLMQGNHLGWPVSTTYLKRMGTSQNQSADISARMPDSAVQSHGNYGVEYRIGFALHNPTSTPVTLAWRWTQPASLKNNAEATPEVSEVNYHQNVHKSVHIVFRGTLEVQSGKDTANAKTVQRKHLSIRQGVFHEPFYTLKLAPDEKKNLFFRWVYPADAIPPQLLSLSVIPSS